MLHAIHAEFRKFFTIRLWWGMAIAMFLAGGAFAALFAYFFTSDVARQQGAPVGDATQIANSVYTGGIQIGYLLMLTIGIMQIGSEYRHKTITGTFLATPRRIQPMLAKVVALLGIGAVYAVISMAASVAVGAVVLTARGHEAFPSTGVYRTLALSLLVLGLWALIGLGVGILLPNQVAALLIGVGVAWIVEPLAALLLTLWEWGSEHVTPYLPTQATGAIVNAVTQPGQPHQLSWWAASITLACWALVLAGIGVIRVQRQDIT